MLWRKKLMNPFRRYYCPQCATVYHPGDCAIVSLLPSGTVLQKKRSSPLLRLFTRALVTSLLGRKATLLQAIRQCPNPLCNYLLPKNDAKSCTIAIVGDVSSGKSLYIASCIYQLIQGHAAQMIGSDAIRGMGDTNERYYTEYYQPVYLSRRRLIPTVPAGQNRPLIYELEFANRETLNLLFYDSSGEDIRDSVQMVQYSRYVLNASAIIFLADPMQMPGIVQTLPSHLRPDPGALQKLTTAMVLDRVIGTFRDARAWGRERKIETPIAITVSKSDLLTFATALDPQTALYLYDNTYTNQLDIAKFATISAQVEELLRHLGDQQLVRMSKKFQNICFFAVTATGWNPDSNGEFPPLEPKRCLDPVLWALWKLGVIDPERG